MNKKIFVFAELALLSCILLSLPNTYDKVHAGEASINSVCVFDLDDTYVCGTDVQGKTFSTATSLTLGTYNARYLLCGESDYYRYCNTSQSGYVRFTFTGVATTLSQYNYSHTLVETMPTSSPYVFFAEQNVTYYVVCHATNIMNKGNYSVLTEFYASDGLDDSGEFTELTDLWFSSYGFSNFLGSYYEDNENIRKECYYNASNFVSSCKLYMVDVTSYSPTSGLHATYTTSHSWGVTEIDSFSITPTVSASISFSLKASAGASLSMTWSNETITEKTWNFSESVTYDFDNTNFYYDSNGILKYIPMKLVYYIVYAPIYIKEYSLIFGSYYLAKSYYICDPIITGYTLFWNEPTGEVCQDRTGQNVVSSLFMSPLSTISTSIMDLYQ